MKEIPRRYIEGRIQTTRTKISDDAAVKLSEGLGSLKSQAEHAQYWAREGLPTLSASFLSQDNTLPVSTKGEILAVACTKGAEHSEDMARTMKTINSEEGATICRIRARQLRKIAQGLTRAVQRTQKP
jgi:hypothetical protein